MAAHRAGCWAAPRAAAMQAAARVVAKEADRAGFRAVPGEAA